MEDMDGPTPVPPEETLSELYEYAPCGYLTADWRGNVVRVNATLLQWLGLARVDLLGRSIQMILTRAGRIFFETHVIPALSLDGHAGQVALDLARADGGRMHVLSDWREVVVNGAVVGVRAMLVDATDRRAYERDLLAERRRLEEVASRLSASEAHLRDLNESLEGRVAERSAELEQAHEQLRHSQKLEAIGNLTGGVAHDFNNLLSPIIGGLDMLERRFMHDERAQLIIANALASAEKARTLVQRLLAFARRQPLLPVPVDMAALLRGMVDLMKSTLGPRIEMAMDIADPLPCALADANQIEMALLNIAVNARDAMPDGGRLTVVAEQEGARFVKLTLSDTGLGMDAETLERAIEPFFSTKEPGKGTGLGLSMVHGLAAQLGGHLTLNSQPGRGTSVILHLPVALAAQDDMGDGELYGGRGAFACIPHGPAGR